MRGVGRGRMKCPIIAKVCPSQSVMAHAKDKHYWTQLRTALTAGHWKAETAAQAPNAKPLSWSQLFYKFNKHCRGFQDVAEIAVQTRTLVLLLEANATDGNVLRLGHECVLAPERVQEAHEGYQALMKLESKHSDVRKTVS